MVVLKKTAGFLDPKTVYQPNCTNRPSVRHCQLCKMTQIASSATLKDRYVPLEFLRGVAAIVVFIDHFFLLFMPQLTGVYNGEQALNELRVNSSGFAYRLFQALSPVSGSPLFCFLNATASVQFFFVLSAYVLTVSFFSTGHVKLLWIGAIKRYFRLFGPVFVSIMTSYALMKAQLYYTDQTADLSTSIFARTRGRISPHLGQIGPYEHLEPNLLEALLEGSVWTFFRGDTTYLASMWIIRYDLFGASLAFFTAYLYSVFSFPRDLKTVSIWIIMALVHLIPPYVSPYSIYFLAGVFMSFYHNKLDNFVIKSKWKTSLMYLGIIYCMGFYYPLNGYSWVKHFLLPLAKVETIRVYFYAFGSMLLIHVCMKHEGTYKLLSQQYIGKVNVGKLFGLYSVGFYFLGLQLDFSLGSLLFVKTYQPTSYWGEMVTFVVTFASLTVAADIFAHLDSMWTAQVNWVFSRVSKLV